MNKKMRDLLEKINSKKVLAKSFMEEDNKDIKKANALLDEIDKLEEEYKAEERLYKLEKEFFMELIDQVSINALSKRDLLLILKALEYTNENTGLEDFIDLRNNIVKEICFLTETTEEDFINYLESSK